MVDFHTHLLPELDDGAQSINEAFDMLTSMNNQGIDRIVLTPHYYCLQQSIDSFVLDREQSFQTLTSLENANNFVFTLGAEVLLQKKLFANESFDALKIGETKFMLIELDFIDDFDQVLEHIEQLIYCYNTIPVIAHIENYAYFHKRPNDIIRLIELGCLIQINTGSVFNGNKKFVFKLIRNNFVHLIGTDCHNNTTRKPIFTDFKNALKQNNLLDFLDYAKDNASCALNNIQLNLKNPKPIKNLFSFL